MARSHYQYKKRQKELAKKKKKEEKRLRKLANKAEKDKKASSDSVAQEDAMPEN